MIDRLLYFMRKTSRLPLGLVDNTAEKQFVYRRRLHGKPYYRGFSYRGDAKKSAVKKEAVRYAHQMNDRLGPTITTPKGTKTVRNSSGVVGVGLSRNTVRGQEYYSWVARWPGNQSGTRFSVDAHGGDNKAFLLACISRELETDDRKKIDRAYKRWRQSGKAQKFLNRKQLKLV
jgi:hypothetical protein